MVISGQASGRLALEIGTVWSGPSRPVETRNALIAGRLSRIGTGLTYLARHALSGYRMNEVNTV